MRRDDFFALNAAHGARPARSSSIRAIRRPEACARRIPTVTAQRPLASSPMPGAHDEPICRPNPVRRGAALRGLGLSGQRALMVRCRSVEELLAQYHAIEAERAELPYDIDGVVYKVDQLDLQERLGLPLAQPALGDRAQIPRREGDERCSSHRHPGGPHRRADAGGAAGAGHGGRRGGHQRHAAQRGYIEASIDGQPICEGANPHRRHGAACSAPATSSRRVVDVVLEKRPADARPFEFPHRVPVRIADAGGARGNDEAEAKASSAAARANLICPSQRIEHLRHFVSRRAFDIEGLGEKQIEFFFNDPDLPVKSPADIFTLQARGERAERGQAARTSEGLTATVSGRQAVRCDRSRRRIALERMIFALGIRHVGETTARVLARGYGSWNAFHDAALAVHGATRRRATEMDAVDHGIGDTVIDAVGRLLGRGAQSRAARGACSEAGRAEPRRSISSSPVAGKTVVFTGALERCRATRPRRWPSGWGPRPPARFRRRPTWSWPAPGAGSKLKQATELGIEVIDEDAWFNWWARGRGLAVAPPHTPARMNAMLSASAAAGSASVCTFGENGSKENGPA